MLMEERMWMSGTGGEQGGEVTFPIIKYQEICAECFLLLFHLFVALVYLLCDLQYKKR